MLKIQTTRYTRLLIAVYLMLMLAFSVIGTAAQSQVLGATPTAVIACNGGSGGSCGG